MSLTLITLSIVDIENSLYHNIPSEWQHCYQVAGSIKSGIWFNIQRLSLNKSDVDARLP